jgi:hypothetical protein
VQLEELGQLENPTTSPGIKPATFRLIACLSLSLPPVAPTSEHRASVKCFVSLQFLNPKTVGRFLERGDQPVARPLPTQDNTE